MLYNFADFFFFFFGVQMLYNFADFFFFFVKCGSPHVTITRTFVSI